MSQRELVDRLHLDRSSVSRLVERLVDRGWVSRAAGERDRRTIRLEATPAGELIAASIAETRSSRFSALLDAVPMDRRDGALDAIRLLTQAARLIEE
jgi:DNA-binding MarR family transcriptional regulator